MQKPEETGRAQRKPSCVPTGRRVYAVGDIHGRADLLQCLHDLIADDLARAPSANPVIVYLGDYIDRGPQSRRVIDLLLGRPLGAVEKVHLLGNHERALLRFLDDTSIGPAWFAFGGIATLLSFGIQVTAGGLAKASRLSTVQADLRRALSPLQLGFLRSLRLMHVECDYAFVHAGIRPGVPLGRQTEQDLLNIREEFLDSAQDHEKVIVHGHSLSERLQLKANRIGIDTGAYATGRLTCLVLEGAARDFLQT